jgi:hypothetical protein
MKSLGEFRRLKPSSRRGSRRAANGPLKGSPEKTVQELRRIGSRLRADAKGVLREYLLDLSRMGLDTVESVAYLGCVFLNAMLEEAPGVRAELTHQLERFLRGRELETTDRAGRSFPLRRRREGERGPIDAAAGRGRGRRGRS